MIGRTIVILISIGLLTVVGVAVVGRLWRFILIRPQGPTGPRSVLQRIVVLKPGPRDFAEQESCVARFDLPFTALFLAGSLYLLATPGVGGAWLLTFVLWCAGAVTRWLTPSDRIVQIRCGIVVLLVVEAVLVLLIRGGSALPQTLIYLFAALVGALLLYAANELPLPFAPQGPSAPARRRSRNTRCSSTRCPLSRHAARWPR
jgi:hypothetical protein